MTRLVAAFVAPAVVLAVAPAAPVPKHLMRADPLYFPTAVGTRWVFVDENGADEVRVLSAAARHPDGGVLVTTELVAPDGTRTPRSKVRVFAGGLEQVEESGERCDPPFPLLRGTRPGDGWSFATARRPAGAGPHARFAGRLTVAGPERVEVPAGVFAALRVDMTWTMDDDPTEWEVSRWYAPGVGLVRQTYAGGEKALKAFTPGKP